MDHVRLLRPDARNDMADYVFDHATSLTQR